MKWNATLKAYYFSQVYQYLAKEKVILVMFGTDFYP